MMTEVYENVKKLGVEQLDNSNFCQNVNRNNSPNLPNFLDRCRHETRNQQAHDDQLQSM